MRVVLMMLSLCLGCASATEISASAPQRRAPNKITVRANGRTRVVVNERGRAHRLDIAKHIGAARIEEASVLFLTREGESIYLVLQVCGLSKLPPDDRQCGAGIECNLVWLKLDSRWRVRDAKTVLYESCWLPITSDEGPAVSGRRVTLEYEDLREEMHYKVDYDADHPEKGFAVEKKPIPKTANRLPRDERKTSRHEGLIK